MGALVQPDSAFARESNPHPDPPPSLGEGVSFQIAAYFALNAWYTAHAVARSSCPPPPDLNQVISSLEMRFGFSPRATWPMSMTDAGVQQA